MAHLFDLDSYTAPIGYVISHFIREYDISKANINILLYKNLISKNQYEYYYNLPKQQRAILVGLLQRDNPKIRLGLTEGFGEVRHMFYKENNIHEYQVLSVKKDAIFLIDCIPKVTKFGNIEFVNKNIYTSFYNLDKIEYYYYADNNIDKLDVKGISDNILILHQNYMLDYLKYIFRLAQYGRIIDAIYSIQSFYNSFITYDLDIGYYRELNNRSLFRTKYILNEDRIYINGFNNNTDIHDIDGSYNVGILMDIYKILMNQYLKGR